MAEYMRNSNTQVGVDEFHIASQRKNVNVSTYVHVHKHNVKQCNTITCNVEV